MTRPRRAPATLVCWCAVAVAAAAPAQARVQVYDDHRAGFPADRWVHAPLATGFVPDDGLVSTADRQLRVRAAGTNPTSGQPAFTRTMAQEDDNAFGVHGQLDHHKFSVLTARRFDARAGEELTFEATVTAQTFGTAGQPFGAAVADPRSDARLAHAAFGAADPDSRLRFEFVVTETGLHALYARDAVVPAQMERDAAFTFLVPLAARAPGDQHRLAVAYDRRAGTVRWVVDGRERFRVSRLGARIDRRWMVLDHGGTEEVVSPAQLAGTFALRSMLDASPPGGGAPGLARLSNLPFFYFDPAVGEPAPQLMVDGASFDSSRLFGQGAAIALGPVLVSDQGPVCGRALAGIPLLGALLDQLACTLAITLGALR